MTSSLSMPSARQAAIQLLSAMSRHHPGLARFEHDVMKFGPEVAGGGWQLAMDEVGRITELSHQRGQNLAIGSDDSVVRRRHVVGDFAMEFGEGVVRHHR